MREETRQTGERSDDEPSLAAGMSAYRLLDSTLDSIVVYRFEDDGTPLITYCNRAAAETRGYSRDEMIGRPLMDLIADEEQQVVAEHVKELLEHGRLTYETVHKRKDGSRFPVEVRVSLSGAGPGRQAVAVYRDISESMSLRYELDAALQRALTDRSQLRTMMDAVPVGMALVGPNAEVLEVNQTNEKIWRTTEHPRPPELEGYVVFRGWDPQTGVEYRPADWPVADVMRTGEPVWDRLVRIERFDGSQGIVEISAIPVKDADGVIQSMVVLTIDVTDRERREHMSLALDDLNLEIHSTLNRNHILDRVLSRAFETYEADFGMILHLEGESCVLERYTRLAQGLDKREPYARCTHGLTSIQKRRPLFIEDVSDSPDVADEAKTAGLGAMVVVPLFVTDDSALVLEVSFKNKRVFDSADRDFAHKVGDFASFALDNSRLYTELAKSVDEIAEKDRGIRQAYSDVIEAVTGGRLILLDADELRDEMLPDSEPRSLIDSPSQLGDARRRARTSLVAAGVGDDMLLAFGEALNNALKYAGEASYAVNANESRLQVVVADHGPGIDFSNLPKATLISGFSTTHTLGVGFTLMMELTDRVLLCTNPAGTTVVLERAIGAGSAARATMEGLA